MNRIVSKYQRTKITAIKKRMVCPLCHQKIKLMQIFPLNNNNRKLMEYVDLVCSEMISLWLPKLLMDIIILVQHYKDYNIIKNINEDCLQRVYFEPQKYPVSNQFQGHGYALLCKVLATSAMKQGYQIVKTGLYVVRGLTINRISCSRCIQYKGNMNYRKSFFFVKKLFIMMQETLME